MEVSNVQMTEVQSLVSKYWQEWGRVEVQRTQTTVQDSLKEKQEFDAVWLKKNQGQK